VAIPSVSNTSTIRLSGQPSSSSLEAGELVMAKVEAADHGKASAIRIKGRLLKAEIPPDLKAGKEYLLQVKSVFPRIILSVASGGAHLTLTKGPEKILRYSSDLISIMEKATLILAEGSSSQSSVMKGLFDSILGLFYTGDGAESIKKRISSLIGRNDSDDKNQHDIQEGLVKFLTKARKGNVPVPAPLREEIEALLKDMEIFRSGSNDVYPLPFLFDDEAGVASFYYNAEEKKGDDGGRDHFFTLTIEMSGLGEVETSVRRTKSGLIILFRVDHESVIPVMMDTVQTLREAIAGTGYKVRHIEADVRGKREMGEESQRNIDEGVDLAV